jgi:hypothetical protein
VQERPFVAICTDTIYFRVPSGFLPSVVNNCWSDALGRSDRRHAVRATWHLHIAARGIKHSSFISSSFRITIQLVSRSCRLPYHRALSTVQPTAYLEPSNSCAMQSLCRGPQETESRMADIPNLLLGLVASALSRASFTADRIWMRMESSRGRMSLAFGDSTISARL